MSKIKQPSPKEPLEWIKDLVGSTWSGLVVKLGIFIITAFGAGFGLGYYISGFIGEKNLLITEMKHQKELYEERKAGKDEAMEETKRQKDQAEYMIKILNDRKVK